MTTVLDLGTTRLTRVLYLDAAIDPDPVGLTPAQVRSVPWASPDWADGDKVRAASCVWVVSQADRHIAIDPSGNIDEILHDPDSAPIHQRAYVAAFDAAGIPIDSIDTVLLSHIESIGLTAVRDDDDWRPFFPNARVLISDTAAAHFDAARPPSEVGDAFASMLSWGLVDTFADGDEIIPGLHAEWTGIHNPGHCAFHVRSEATFVGHLAVTPLHLATGPCAPQNPADPEGAWRWLQTIKAGGRILIGPLWPSPGAIRFAPDGSPLAHLSV
jgi:hypothetical protein